MQAILAEMLQVSIWDCNQIDIGKLYLETILYSLTYSFLDTFLLNGYLLSFLTHACSIVVFS